MSKRRRMTYREEIEMMNQTQPEQDSEESLELLEVEDHGRIKTFVYKKPKEKRSTKSFWESLAGR